VKIRNIYLKWRAGSEDQKDTPGVDVERITLEGGLKIYIWSEGNGMRITKMYLKLRSRG
jgi:hypothetical protein